MPNDEYDTRIPMHPEEAFEHGITFHAKVRRLLIFTIYYLIFIRPRASCSLVIPPSPGTVPILHVETVVVAKPRTDINDAARELTRNYYNIQRVH